MKTIKTLVLILLLSAFMTFLGYFLEVQSLGESFLLFSMVIAVLLLTATLAYFIEDPTKN